MTEEDTALYVLAQLAGDVLEGPWTAYTLTGRRLTTRNDYRVRVNGEWFCASTREKVVRILRGDRFGRPPGRAKTLQQVGGAFNIINNRDPR